MIDLKRLREDPDEMRQNLKDRNMTFDLDALLALDAGVRELEREFEELRSQQNAFSKELTSLGETEKEAKMSEMKKLAERVKAVDALVSEKKAQLDGQLLLLPVYLDPTAARGASEEENKVVCQKGELPTYDFIPVEHWEVAENLGLLDLERGAKVSGSRFFYLKGDLVELELNWMMHVLKKVRAKGFLPMITPYMVREKAMVGTGFFPADKNEIYHVNPDEDDLYLIGTSEVTLVNYFADEVLDVADLPIRLVGFTTCFRREAGSYGKDTKGLLRTHQFEKVEMVSFCHPDRSQAEHEFLREVEEEIVSDLGLPYQLLNICSGDLGAPAAKKYDLEAWFPAQEKYREITSTSNCYDFQSRRLNIRFKDTDGKLKYVHTLNGTASSTRPLISYIENNQTAEGKIKLTGVMRDLMGKDLIG